MSIICACTCGQKYVVKEEFAGRSTPCKRCGAAIQIPARAPEIAKKETGDPSGSGLAD